MLIVIEGVDRTGKSTLADRLSTLAGGEVWHRSKPTAHPLEEYEASLATYVPNGRNLVVDRWHLGELVWPKIFGRSSEFDWPMFVHVELFLRSRGALLIYARRNPDLIHLHVKELIEYDEPLSDYGLGCALDLYDAVLRDRLDFFRGYDHSQADHRVLMGLLDDADLLAAHVSVVHKVTSEWIGNPSPSMLLIGERFGPAHGKRPAAAVPFVPFRGTSGHFLFGELSRSRLWRDVAICNAFRENGKPEKLRDLWLVLGLPKVVALGNEAAAEAGRQDVPLSGHVPHPQYVRRFKRCWPAGTYHDMIREAGC